ncbi:MAG: type II secretion system F family protein [Candidatus Eisenbacteria bacterium]|uniref:Type II secretion system F family protein n=1 Tax=Eiseniibacteriota bacterium TaxID=2212470 RepID=A0A948RZS7_UNCEI|nr:type II secretion system F family protein [Candidatus Eisenbacteria bacterium]MBU1950621.1 type II secretion system F family protein [Candidatus Eisenbacteria bacterium]MBU2692642.1 type II secretion system F family protein [Candidatus Eisenbacteria bacterium]
MGNFAYIAKTRSGEERSGLISGNSIDDVVRDLHSNGLTVLNVIEDRGQGLDISWFKRFARTPITSVGVREIALFTRQLATIMEAGIPLVRGLRGLADDAGSRTLSRAIEDIAVQIERGESLSNAMSAHPAAFSSMYINMIRAGERAGTLDKILEDLAVYLEKIDAIKTKVRSAMAYPVFVFLFAVAAGLFLLLKIVPTFEGIYADLGQQLPGLTLLMISISQTIRSNAFLTAGALILFLSLIFVWTRTRSGRYMRDLFLIRIPIFGPIIRKAVMSRFARTFGILIRSGLPILESIDLVKGAVGNAYVGHALGKVKRSVGAGQGITDSFRSTGVFPEMVLQLMSTGEESGEMDAMLIKSSDFYDTQVEASVQGLTSLIEPLMIVIVGSMIGVIVIAMFLPIFHLGEAIMKGGYNY